MGYERKQKSNRWDGKSIHSSTKNNRSTKRGKLSPLMTEEQKSSANIQDLSFDFACRITRLYQYLTEDSEYKEFIHAKQVVRSGSSIGANVREAQHAQSDADFLSKMSIAYKEADETEYWLNILHCNGYLSDEESESIINDNQRILRLLTSIVKSTKAKIERSKVK